jgi:antitoxin (DNA-binding transcriptional repressor) of toxin-antitoxin stability system
MKKAGIAELKNRLSYYLQLVRKGQPVLVLDRDVPVARIEPVLRTVHASDPDDWTAEMERVGALRAPERELPRDWRKHRPNVKSDVVAAILAERDEGR